MKSLLTCFSISFLIVLVGCHPNEPVASLGDPKTCEGCHTNKELLKSLLEEDILKSTPKILGST